MENVIWKWAADHHAVISLIAEAPGYKIKNDDGHSKAILRTHVLDMLSRIDKDMVINKVEAWVSVQQRGKSGINKGFTYIRYPAYFETAVQAWVVILDQAKAEDTHIVAHMLKGTDKVREGFTAFHKGWNVTIAGYELPQLSKDDYYKIKEEVKEQDTVALNPDLVYSQMSDEGPEGN